MDGVTRFALAEGLRGGVALGACVIALAVLGLSPSMSWVPEVLLLTLAAVVPVAAFALLGRRVARRTGRVLAGAIVGGIAGAISGGIGGVAYVVFGKSVLNIGVGVVSGAIGGAVIAGVAAVLSRRSESR